MTGFSTLTDDERLAEAGRILKIIEDCGELEQMTPWEQQFIGEMGDATTVSPAQLQKMRDIKDKYL